MDYLDAQSVRKSKKIRERIKEFAGPAVRHGFALMVVKKYAKQINDDPKILDCGTARGQFFADLAGAGFGNLYGVDIDDYLQPDKKKLAKEFKIADLSFEKIPWGDEFFDLLTGWCLMPHLENPFNFIREAYRVLKPNGLLMYSTVNVASPSHRKYFYEHGDLPGYHERNNHISIITPAIFKKAVLRYFDVLGTEYFITPRIFNGLRGGIRKIAYSFCGKFPRLKLLLDKRWGAKIFYVLRKKKKLETADLLEE